MPLFSRLRRTYDTARVLWDSDVGAERLDKALETLRDRTPAPTFWLLGKTQSGKTSLIKFFTNAGDAEVGTGFRATTKTTREYPYPAADAPVLTFLDTRGLDEPGYDPAEDIAACGDRSHLILVTVKLTDFAQKSVHDIVTRAKKARPMLPVILVVTCLHEAYPGEQHPAPYPDGGRSDIARRIQEHRDQFAGLTDAVVAVDLTRPEEGFEEVNYGGDQLRTAVLDHLPGAFRETLRRTAALAEELKDIHLSNAIPVISGYASLAASAGAIPIPFVDLLLLPAIQARMVYHLARVSGRPLEATAFLELAASLGLGLLARQGIRELVKFIPVVGSAAAAALAGASTFALGRAFVLYYQEVHSGHVPDPATLRKFYFEQMARAERAWKPAPSTKP